MSTVTKQNIALVTGGDSGELEISLESADEVAKHLDSGKYEVYKIIIKKQKWVYNDEGDEIPVDKNDFSIVLDTKRIFFDCVFIALHGTPGEDGKLQGYFDLLDIPYTSCGRTTTALTFNKFFSNKIARSFGVSTAESIFLPAGDTFDLDKIIEKSGLPCFVKPNNNGSSVGISRVDNREQLPGALELAFNADNEVVVEEFIDGFELTCGVFKYFDQMYVLPLTKIISKKDFFDYEAKYTDGMAEEITPAPVSQKIEHECKRTSAFLYNEFNCKGIVRFDYIVKGDTLYFLEVNTVPGMTKNSIVPKMVMEMGLSLKELYSMVIEDSVIRHKGT